MSRKDIDYANVIIAYDIETSSWRDSEGVKRSIVYNHHIQVEDKHYNFRYFADLYDFLNELIYEYGIWENKRLVIYVHNLSYEFQFIKQSFEWDDVFCIGKRSGVARATTSEFIEFRCSYFLTNAPLAYIGEQVGVDKMVGDLDYDLMRTPETPLTDEEMGYIYNDTEIIVALLRDKLKGRETLKTIPMTSTGYVRRQARARTIGSSEDYVKLIKKLTLEEDEYLMLDQAYAGGYVHANPDFVGETIKDVRAIDLASSYPGAMLEFTYPMGKGVNVTRAVTNDIKAFNKAIKNKHAVMTLKLIDIHWTTPYAPISASKCIDIKNGMFDNGRVVSADSVTLTLTDVDLKNYKRMYNIASIEVIECWVYKPGYLPKELIEFTLELYEDKTTLKGVEGKEEQYGQSKALLNAIYGMMVTSPIKPETAFDHENRELSFELDPSDIPLQLEEENNSHRRFLYYPWGVWITAYARMVLLDAMILFHDNGVEDYYCDTDSRYVQNDPKVDKIIDHLNKGIIKRVESVLTHYGIDPKKASPKDPDGVERPIGVWEHDGYYKEFKTLGAKRYAGVTMDDEFVITVSGVNKKKGAKYIESIGGMEAFTDGLYLPKEESGKNTASYIESEFEDEVTDYLGNTTYVYQHGYVHIEPTDYKLSLGVDYKELLLELFGKSFDLELTSEMTYGII